MDLDRLALPKRSFNSVSAAGDVEVVEKTPTNCVPLNGLPLWEKLSLDAKLPVIASPKNAFVLYTTNLCERIHNNSRDRDFILTDPEARFLSNDYQALHDPHLKCHMSKKRMKYRLYRGGFITRDGKVLCTLKEFNKYRQYLRRIDLEKMTHARKKREEEIRAKLNGKRSGGLLTTGEVGSHQTKVKDVRRRLKEQYEADKERYKNIMLEDEARQERLTHEKFNKMSETEDRRITERARREALLKRQELEGSRRKMHMHRKWIIEDEMRRARADERRLNREIELQKKLEEAWSLRKQIQLKRIQDEETVRQRDSDERKKNVRERDSSILKQRKKQGAIFIKMQDQARKEREKQEAICRRRLEREIEIKRRERARKRRKSRRVKNGLESEWNLEDTLEKDVVTGVMRKYSKEELGVTDLRGARFSKECIIEEELQPQQSEYPATELGKKAQAKRDLLLKREASAKDRPNKCNFACLTAGKAEEEDNDIPLGVPVVNRRMSQLQRDIQPKFSASNINLQLIAAEADDDSSFEDESPPQSEEKLGEEAGSRCLGKFRDNFNTAAAKLSGSVETLASFVVGWTINIAQMIVHPSITKTTSLCDLCETDLKIAYCPSDRSIQEEEENIRRAARRGVRFSVVEETIPRPESADVEADAEDDIDQGSLSHLNLKDSLTKLRGGKATVETLISNLKTLLDDLGEGKLSPEDVVRLELITTEVLQTAAAVAGTVSAVAPEDELRADAGKKRSAILIESMISQIVNNALQDINQTTEVSRTSSELVGDMIGYALNQAVDEAKSYDTDCLARRDSVVVGKFLEDTIHRALYDIDHLRLSAEGVLVTSMIQNALVTVTTDIRTGCMPMRALENLAMAIVRSSDMVKQSQSDTGVAERPPTRRGRVAHEYIRTALLKLVEAIDGREFNGDEIASIADHMCSSVYDAADDSSFRRASSPASVTVMSAFVKDVINNCLSQLTDDTAAKIITRMLSNAALSPSANAEDRDVMSTSDDMQDTGSTEKLNTFVQNILNKSLDSSDDESEVPNAYLAGALSETVLENFIKGVLAGFGGEETLPNKPKKPPIKKASLTDLVMDSYIKKVMDSAIDQCHRYTESQESNISMDDTPSEVVSIYIREVLSKGKQLAAAESASTDSTVSELAKQISSCLVQQVEKKKSEELHDGNVPKESSSIDLMDHSHESHSQVFSDESSDEEDRFKDLEPLEVEITPVLRNKLLDINPEEIAPALSAISMRASMAGHLAHRFEATARNSFASLLHPDLSRVRGLKKDSASDVKKKLHDAYVQSVMQVSKDTVVVSDDVLEPGEMSEESDSEEEEGDEIRAIDGCPSTAMIETTENQEPIKKSSSSMAKEIPSTSQTSKSSIADDVASSSSGTLKQRNSKTKIPSKRSSGNVNEKSPSSDKMASSSSSATRVPRVTSSGSRSNGAVGTSSKEGSLEKRRSNGSRSSLQKPRSQIPVGSPSAGKQDVGKKRSPSQNQVTPKSSKKSISSAKSTGSSPKVTPVRGSKTSGSTSSNDRRAESREAMKASSAGKVPSKKSSKASPASSGVKIIPSKTSKTPSGKSIGESRSSGRAGPAETGSINDLRAEKEMKKALSGHYASQARSSSSTKDGSPAQHKSSSKLLSRRASEEKVPIASTSGQPGRRTPSDSVIDTKDQSGETSAADTSVPRILSEGEVVKVRSLFGSFSSTIQVRSNTDVHKSDSSSTKVVAKGSASSVKSKGSRTSQ